MSNEIKHHKYVLEFDTWNPFDKAAMSELDEIIHRLREKKLLAHAGNVRLSEVE